MPSGIHDPSRGGCPHSCGPYRKAWVQGWWRHYYRQPRSAPTPMYFGFHRAWMAGWDHFEKSHHHMAHAGSPVTAGDRQP